MNSVHNNKEDIESNIRLFSHRSCFVLTMALFGVSIDVAPTLARVLFDYY